MDPKDHRSLLDRLTSRIESGPPTLWGDPREYYHESWRLIKEIGAGFKDTRYPTGGEKQQAWNSFQATVNVLKEQQAAHDKERADRSREVRQALLVLADAGSPARFGLIEALFAGAEDAVGMVVDAGVWLLSLGFIKPDPTDPQLKLLRNLSDNHKRAWAKFKEEQKHLIRADHQQVYERLQEVRGELDEAWGEFKRLGQENFEHRQRRREEWREKQTTFLAVLKSQEANQEAYLEKKESELISLRAKRDEARGDSYRERLEGWMDECQDKITNVEEDLKKLRAKITEVEAKL